MKLEDIVCDIKLPPSHSWITPLELEYLRNITKEVDGKIASVMTADEVSLVLSKPKVYNVVKKHKRNKIIKSITVEQTPSNIVSTGTVEGDYSVRMEMNIKVTRK